MPVSPLSSTYIKYMMRLGRTRPLARGRGPGPSALRSRPLHRPLDRILPKPFELESVGLRSRPVAAVEDAPGTTSRALLGCLRLPLHAGPIRVGRSMVEKLVPRTGYDPAITRFQGERLCSSLPGHLGIEPREPHGPPGRCDPLGAAPPSMPPSEGWEGRPAPYHSEDLTVGRVVSAV